MTDPIAELKSSLAEKGGRWTRARERVLEAFLGERRPLTPRDVHRRTGGEMSPASVYRNIRLLKELGLVVAVDRVGEGERFELSDRHRDHHHHVICDRCGAVEDLDGCLLQSLERRVRKDTRYRITRHMLNLFGLCPSCAA
jgi:Fur family ferric uptake transcriptional regulator